jgi:protein-L-isoaspartate(D-aspartate) O-methyltransferase
MIFKLWALSQNKKYFVYIPFLALLMLNLLLSSCSPQTPEPTLISTATPTSTIASPKEDPTFANARKELVEKAVQTYDLQNEDVIEAFASVPRHKFVPEEYVDMAYEDMALPIGYGQTISQPSLVAWMTELLELEPGEKVLEIGTGSGYQAAILAELGYVEVYSIEIVPQLYERTSQLFTIKELGYPNVHLKQGDGYYGWPEHAPYDAIIVTAAPDHLPPQLEAQLAEGGILLIPIGPPGFYQTLWKFVKEEGGLTAYNMGSVIFVPFTGEGVKSEPTP